MSSVDLNKYTTVKYICYHKEGPYQDRPPLCPFRLLPLLIYSGSTIASLKFQGPKSKNICGDRVKGVDGQSRPKNPRMNALNRLPKHRNKLKCQGGSITVLLQPPNGPTRP